MINSTAEAAVKAAQLSNVMRPPVDGDQATGGQGCQPAFAALPWIAELFRQRQDNAYLDLHDAKSRHGRLTLTRDNERMAHGTGQEQALSPRRTARGAGRGGAQAAGGKGRARL